MVRRLQLAAGADWVELTNVIDKKQAPLNPKPGNARSRRRFRPTWQ